MMSGGGTIRVIINRIKNFKGQAIFLGHIMKTVDLEDLVITGKTEGDIGALSINNFVGKIDLEKHGARHMVKKDYCLSRFVLSGPCWCYCKTFL